MSSRKNNHSLVFDQVLPTSSSAITGAIMQANVIPHAHVGVDVPNQELKLQWRLLLLKLLYPNHWQ
jgi:hypothetical protein